MKMLKKTPTKAQVKFTAFVAGSLLLCFAPSCKKEASLPSTVSKQENIAMVKVPSYRSLDMSEPELYVYTDDVAMERIDMARYALGKALKELLTAEMLTELREQAIERANRSLLFSTIFELYPSLEESLNESLSMQELPECPYDFTNYQSIKYALFDDYDSYEPQLFFYNLNSTAKVSSFILSPGLEIEDEDGFDDQIMAWHKDEHSSFSEIKLNEKEAKLSNILITSLGLKGNIVWPNPTGPGTTPNPPSPTLYKSISMQKVNIHHRFEKNGKSEVYAYGVQSSGSTNFEKCFSTFPGDFSRHLTSTKKTWQWVDCDKNKLLFNVSKNVIWNVFERDWYQPWQPVSIFNGATNTTAWVPMTNANEWYALVPSTNSLSNNKSLKNGSGLKNAILANGTNWTYFQGENNKFECYFNAQQ